MAGITCWIRLARPKQWLKNGFVAVPLFFSGRLRDSEAVLTAAAAVALFCLISSAVYVLNDYRDRAADAAHPKKRTRPLASGEISPRGGLLFLAAIVASAAALFFFAALPPIVGWIILGYSAINIAYSFGLKHVSLLELFLVASGFVLRLLAGGFALDLPLSNWLLAMTGVISMLIATAKRRAEIADGYDPQANRRSLNGYNLSFLDSVISMLGGMTIVFYLLFATSEYGTARYGAHTLLFGGPVLAYGVLRFIQLTKVFSGADDPTELVVRDPGIALSVLIFGGIYGAVLYF